MVYKIYQCKTQLVFKIKIIMKNFNFTMVIHAIFWYTGQLEKKCFWWKKKTPTNELQITFTIKQWAEIKFYISNFTQFFNFQISHLTFTIYSYSTFTFLQDTKFQVIWITRFLNYWITPIILNYFCIFFNLLNKFI